MAVLVAIVLAAGEPLTWYWLLVIPVLLLQAVFNVGAGLILARVGAGIDDVSQLLPFIVRTWMYTSGVMFSIQTLSSLATAPQAQLPPADQPGGRLHHPDQACAAEVAAAEHPRRRTVQPPLYATSTTKIPPGTCTTARIARPS